ncbi:MAG: carboxypeptidase-like regulatory domain-containing protein, partial [Fidelibacterota bacterium]
MIGRRVRILKFSLVILFTISLAHSNSFPDVKAAITGVVVNGTLNFIPQKGQQVELLVFRGEQTEGEVLNSFITGRDGRFSFSNLDPEFKYQLSVEHKGVKYEDYYFDPDSSNFERDFKIIVYDTTKSDDSIRVELHHIFLEAEEGVLSVREILRINNPVNKVYVGSEKVSENVYKTIKFHIPRGVMAVNPGFGLMQCCVYFDGEQFFDTMELKPGVRDVSFSYIVPYSERELDFIKTISYPSEAIEVLISNPEVKVN